ncbi:MAG: transglutaminase-like domain-containing protein [Deltaproteobacteria bacterium]|nr:transglutaminase-like domain-containing protein [Deltaproteobacteria bacterium]
MPSRLAELLADPFARAEAVACAVEACLSPQLDEATLRAELDAIAEPLRPRMRALTDPRRQAFLLSNHLYTTLGFRGNESQYYDPRNSLISQVIARRMGIPITLGVLWIALGDRLELDVKGVGFPGHFLVRLGGDEGVLVDPFFRGAVLDDAALERLLRRTTGTTQRVQPAFLQTVSTSMLATRMLSNLDGIYAGRGEHAHAMITADQLYELTGRAEHLRDRGLRALALGATASAHNDLEQYLLASPDADDRARITEKMTLAKHRPATLH